MGKVEANPGYKAGGMGIGIYVDDDGVEWSNVLSDRDGKLVYFGEWKHSDEAWKGPVLSEILIQIGDEVIGLENSTAVQFAKAILRLCGEKTAKK